jgi:hypothetical protein
MWAGARQMEERAQSSEEETRADPASYKTLRKMSYE